MTATQLHPILHAQVLQGHGHSQPLPDTRYCGCSQTDGSPPNSSQGSSLGAPPPPRGEFSWQKPLLLMGTVTSISLHAFAGFCTLGGSVQTLGSREGDGNSQMAKELACADSFSFSTMVATSQYSHYCVFAFCSRIIMRAYVQFAGSQQIAACFFSAHTHLLRALGVS